MQEEAIYRCVNPACARLMPRPVKFCPWCGTAQAGAPAAEAGRAPAVANAAASAPGWSDAPPPPTPTGAREPAPHAGHETGTAAARAGLAGARADAGSRADADARASASTDAPAPSPAARARGRWLGTAFGHGADKRVAPAAEPKAEPGVQPEVQPTAEPTAQSVPRPAIPARPDAPQRAPIRLRYWVLVLLLLWGVWLLAGPDSSRKIEQRIAHAAALADACKAKEAQDELIALRKTRATSEQLERLQAALNDGAAACLRKRQKEKAWNEASAAAESALAAGNPERASARLQVYTRRYGDDARGRALRQRIEDARHPLAAPSESP